MNTNNIKTKSIFIDEFKIYSGDGMLKIEGNGQVFNLLSGKKVIDGGFFSTKDSEVLILIRKLFRYVINEFKRDTENDSIG